MEIVDSQRGFRIFSYAQKQSIIEQHQGLKTAS